MFSQTRGALILFVSAFIADATFSLLGKRSDPNGVVISIPLTKQLVPVKRNGVQVSHKSAYFGTVQLGGTAHTQEFSMVFDTGSGHVIVPSDSCQSPSCVVHRRFNSKESASAVDIQVDGSPVVKGDDRDQVTVGFGTGQVTGEFVSETVCLGVKGANGHGGVGRCARGMKVVTGIEMSDEPFKAFSFDGVIGLGLPALSLDPSFSFFNQLSSQGRIVQPHFGLFLADSDTQPSEISFGGHNPKRLQSSLEWAPVTQPELGYWQIRVKAIRVAGKEIDYCSDGTCRAIVDTGTSHFGVPIPLIDQLQGALSTTHSANETVDCRDATGPDVEVELEGFALTLGTRDYARRLPFATENPESNVCRPRLMRVGLPAPLGPKMFILGEPVLRKYYTVFNWGDKKVGFGVSQQDSEQDEPEVLMLMQLRVRVRVSRRPTAQALLSVGSGSLLSLGSGALLW